ncbi:hypothetical protein BpHYR1_040002 [Brachionus plicatilis]|uniref:Uncharacterized protein n=1 Tax=Brachionus plicatilis TaxID=10195 RepID=A0A3M7RG83_BRAPC|nr:hypothetical protein BpHYR1_040002 [Brachionus plicatilis]
MATMLSCTIVIHGGFDAVQYCANGLVWRQDTLTSETCDWTLNRRISKESDCGSKKIFFYNIFETNLAFVLKITQELRPETYYPSLA